MNGHPSVSTAEVKRLVITGGPGTQEIALVAGKSIRVVQFYARQSAAGSVQFRSGAGASNLTGLMVTTASDLEIKADFNPFGHFQTTKGEKLQIVSATGALEGWLNYQEV